VRGPSLAGLGIDKKTSAIAQKLDGPRYTLATR
jgi:hypothetical protein